VSDHTPVEPDAKLLPFAQAEPGASAVELLLPLALAWALPAAQAGGEEYRRMILWGQTAHRVVESFAHQRPWWWYLPLLPLLVFPWLFWPRLWRGLAAMKRAPRDAGLRFLAVWLAPTFIAFSLISGKQVHYLVPLIPPFALLASRLTVDAAPGRVATLAVGAAIAYALAQAAAAPYLWRHFDVGPIAREIRKLEEMGRPVAHVGEYHAQYQFAGRLNKPIDVLDADPQAVAAWLERHPDGVLIFYGKTPTGPARSSHPYLDGQVVLLDAEQARAQRLP
ncbi:MAG: hypothetical protein N2690_06290, partial [Rhodocyclaceae bacterium]|nr:hypothetical protein [Rhodocyclaceae bacterium]